MQSSGYLRNILDSRKTYIPNFKSKLAACFTAAALGVAGVVALDLKAEGIKENITEQQVRTHPDFLGTHLACVDRNTDYGLSQMERVEVAEKCEGLAIKHIRGSLFNEQFNLAWSSVAAASGVLALSSLITGLGLALTGTSRKTPSP